jgi:hypothetical protein
VGTLQSANPAGRREGTARGATRDCLTIGFSRRNV